ncbi:MAG TPA: ATP-binding cassette domain-containing protein [Trueperaceae bacterium]|nr:ATP-binding cassette domain-containing protein [Trueperaceae bacterium]
MPAALEAERVTVTFGGLTAVNGVSLSVPQGAIVGLIGPNGAGKTTLFNALTGHVRARGEVRLLGRRVTRLPAYARTRLGMGRTFQVERPFSALTVLENVLVSAFLRTADRREAERRARAALDTVGLGDRALQPAGDLNLARRRRLELARALATEPQVLFLDELMAGLNPPALRDMIEFVRGLARTGMAIVMVEHIMQTVTELCDEVYVLAFGELIARGAPREVVSDPRVVEAYLGVDEDE